LLIHASARLVNSAGAIPAAHQRRRELTRAIAHAQYLSSSRNGGSVPRFRPIDQSVVAHLAEPIDLLLGIRRRLPMPEIRAPVQADGQLRR
jgi:hypothetical protein